MATENCTQRVPVGTKFWRLTVVAFAGLDRGRRTRWRCECECGNMHEAGAYDIKSGNTKSCGCWNRETSSMVGKAKKTHGLTRNPIHQTWYDMMRRCYDSRHNQFSNYGTRGITVCERWHDVERFYEDMGDKPSSRHSIDRLNVNGGYCKENCRWATPSQQGLNKQIHSTMDWGIQHRGAGRYIVRVTVHGSRVCLGTFDTIENARMARDQARAADPTL